MQRNVTISAVMPVYNTNASYLRPAIESILNQTWKDFELIIVDDGSEKGIYQVLLPFVSDKRVKIIRHEHNQGISSARNDGIAASRGKYIATADSDDISYSDRFEKQAIFLEQNPDVGVVGSDIRMIDDSGNVIGFRYYPATDKALRDVLFRCSPFAAPVTMIRRSVFEQTELYNLNFPPAEDIDLWFRIGQLMQLANLPDVLLDYRVHGDSASFRRLHRIERLTLQIRWRAWRTYGYRLSLADWLYNLAQAGSLYLMPAKVRIALYNFFRSRQRWKAE